MADGQSILEDMPTSPSQLIEELVYPFELTQKLVVDFKENRDNTQRVDLKLVLRKLYRSLKYWRLEVPKWLIRRMV